ncbi:MAG: arylsulfatase [Chloroflexi bacterium]|nr:arylsulfatase [Chloroflexota bacterium]
MSASEPAFGGVIGRDYRESTPWWPEPTAAAAGAPNVVFVVLDDVGFADLGCYGSEIQTPNIDRLAAGGLRYANFHTTAMCSPTRACLLTGRNAHSVGMGIIAEWSTGFPAYRGRVTRHAANLAEVLRDQGYNTFAVGKWHLMPMDEATAAGPFGDWPLNRGFDRWYGFHGALADSWHPELFEDNHAIDAPSGEGYHLSEDLVAQAGRMLRDQQAVAPERPFFLYLGFGAAHWPHHVPEPFVEKYRGQYARGWDVIREERLARQKALGIVPPDTALAPRNADVRPWDSLSEDERRLFARMQEVYAGFVEHTDAQVGALVGHLERLGVLDNTLVVLLSDNGSSPEGGAVGAVNARKHLQYEPETLQDGLAAIDALGSDRTYGHYPTGWAQASNTPLKWYKKDVHAGGVRDPLIVHWPARIGEGQGGGIRGQFHHVVDLMPTVLELIGVDVPATFNGRAQLPMHGQSLAYTFDQKDAPTRKSSQYFELLGDRGIWHDGWKAVAKHERGQRFEDDRWELYHLARDFSESNDLAEAEPARLRQMIERWWSEAGAYGALPLDDREYERLAESVAARARQTTVFYPGMARVDRFSAPDITDRSHTIAAEVTIPAGGMTASGAAVEGVLLASGARFGGYVLYVQGGHLVYEYAFSERERFAVRAEIPVPTGDVTLSYVFRRTGRRQGVGTLLVNGQPCGSVTLPKTWPVVAVTAGVLCGRDGGSAVSDAYALPFAFTGTLHRVTVTLDADGAPDPQIAYRAAMSEE